ncbi:MAG: type II toxin-antitoxin system HicA family toxin [Ignavibacteriae bacterium]|nr:type II toxin-antitoxin system HicA family toxin [Ignavibacteriota bacterium]
MRKKIPPMPSRELVRLVERTGAYFKRHGKGDHAIFERIVNGLKRAAPIQMGKRELRPEYCLQVFRQLGITDDEINELLS